ncbi:hypothetical protein EUDG_02935 [Escherichia coli O104:H4 str. 04-8351]|nr:hypothetical protein EUDG_02935 [Escherichia coli O104:H4 str. 04-8351]
MEYSGSVAAILGRSVRLQAVHAGAGCRNGNLRPDQAAEVKLCGLFRAYCG